VKINKVLPDDSVNVSKENSLLLVLKLLIALSIFSSIIFFGINFLIEVVVDALPQKSAIKLTKATSFYVKIPAKEDKNISKILEKTLKCAPVGFKPKVFIISDNQKNAFALGNGNIYLTTGLLKEIKSNEELTFVLGHELGHFKNRDHLKNLGIKLFLVFAKLLGIGVDSFIVSSTIDLQNAHYSQEAELKADKFGLKALICAYGNEKGAILVFNKLKYEDNKSNYLFSSHPSFEKRLKEIKKLAKIYKKRSKNAK
jgi:Zn-dependent protease with chaperone function